MSGYPESANPAWKLSLWREWVAKHRWHPSSSGPLADTEPPGVSPLYPSLSAVDRVALLETALDMAAYDANRFTVEEYVAMAERKLANVYGPESVSGQEGEPR